LGAQALTGESHNGTRNLAFKGDFPKSVLPTIDYRSAPPENPDAIEGAFALHNWNNA
jgi:hypothetical protein